ncbi:MAG: hypothetical protein IPM37_02765 [Hahellaceae bacterium]|nr:hypothetical protein [Hahellaceae bacterium]
MTDSAEQLARKGANAYLLYLLNISFLPGLAFLLQIRQYYRCKALQNAGALHHTRQALTASLLAGLLLAGVSGLIVLAGGLHSPWTWVILILYFTLGHTLLILIGVVGYIRVRNQRPFDLFAPRSWWS